MRLEVKTRLERQIYKCEGCYSAKDWRIGVTAAFFDCYLRPPRHPNICQGLVDAS